MKEAGEAAAAHAEETKRAEGDLAKVKKEAEECCAARKKEIEELKGLSTAYSLATSGRTELADVEGEPGSKSITDSPMNMTSGGSNHFTPKTGESGTSWTAEATGTYAVKITAPVSASAGTSGHAQIGLGIAGMWISSPEISWSKVAKQFESELEVNGTVTLTAGQAFHVLVTALVEKTEPPKGSSWGLAIGLSGGEPCRLSIKRIS